MTGECRPGRRRKERLLTIFFRHRRMYGRLTVLFSENLAIGPYVFRGPEDATEAMVLREIRWDSLEALEENFTINGWARPEAVQWSKEERDRLLAEALTMWQESRRSKNRKRRDRRKRVGVKAKTDQTENRTRMLPWEQ